MLGNVKLRARLRLYLKFINPNEIDLIYKLSKKYPGDKIMFDVGAHVGGSLANFASDGWSVYAFEPDPINRQKLVNTCSVYPNVNIDSRAVSDRKVKSMELYKSDESNGISSLFPFRNSHKYYCSVEATSLCDFCKENKIGHLDFLKIDTEGYDYFVLQGFPFDKIMPKKIVCEFENKKSEPLGYNFNDISDYLYEKKYKILVSEWYPIVKYGGKQKWRTFKEYPCELSDKDAHGNLIAINNDDEYKEMRKIAYGFVRRRNIINFFGKLQSNNDSQYKTDRHS